MNEVSPGEISDYSVIAVGSPTRGAKPARVVKKFLRGLDRKALKGKTATTFSSYAAFRGKATLRRMKRLLKRRKAKVLPGVAFKAGAPLSLWKGPEAEREGCGPPGKPWQEAGKEGMNLAGKDHSGIVQRTVSSR